MEAQLITEFCKEGLKGISWSPRTVELQRGLYSGKGGSASVRRGNSCYLGHATAEIGLLEKVDSLVHVKINCPSGSEFSPSADFTGLSNQNLETTRLAYIDCVTQQVERILMGVIDLGKLKITQSKKKAVKEAELIYTWVLKLNISCISYDGNLFDNALITAVLCLLDLRIPSLAWETSRRWWYAADGGAMKTIDLKYIPVPITRVVIEGQTFFDPNYEMASVGYQETDVYYFNGPSVARSETMNFLGSSIPVIPVKGNKDFVFSIVKRIYNQLITEKSL